MAEVKTKIRISFKSRNQLPELMIIKEYYRGHKVTYAEVLYMEDTYESDVVFDKDANISLIPEVRVEKK